MKKLFISQPMRGKTDEEILATREEAIAKAKELVGEPVEALETFFQSAPANAKPLWYLGESIKYLGDADVAFLPKAGKMRADAALSTSVRKNIMLIASKRQRRKYDRIRVSKISNADM